MNDSRDTSICVFSEYAADDADFPWALHESGAWPPRTQGQLRELWASLALRHTNGLGPRTWRRLAERYQNPMGAVEAVRRWSADGVASEKVAQEFRSERWRGPARAEWDAVRDRGLAVVLWSDPDYPQCLKEIPGPPFYLYRLGNPRLLGGPCVAVVGSRQVSDWAREMARTLGRDLSRAGVTVVSGMARGVDRHAHIGAMEGIGASIAVLGTGPDRVYPTSNRDIFQTLAQGGLVVTEFSPGTEPVAGHFPVRNRIISGLSLGVVVVQAREKSGALITARQALEQGREVFVVAPPENAAGFEGCLQLIEEGAVPVRSAEDILAELGPNLQSGLQGVAAPRPWPAPGKGPHAQTLPEDGPTRANGLPCPADKVIPEEVESPIQERSFGASRQYARSNLTVPASVGDEECFLFAAMEDEATVHVDELAERLDWDVSRVSRVLLMLEMEGLVHQWPGMRYSKSR
ncbi:MAG: DNA-processing protein DprA [Oceanidesulfovibrio sp.]